MFEVEVTGEFSAAHYLKLYDGSLEPRHGHTWKVAVTARAEALDRIGVVVDFEALKPALKKVLSEFDGRSFNDHEAFRGGKLNPSTENIAKLIHTRLCGEFRPQGAKLTRVTVWETPDASATYLTP